MLRPHLTLAPTGDQPPRICFLGVASVARTDFALDVVSLPQGHFLSARLAISLQGYPSGCSGRRFRQTSARNRSKTFRNSPESEIKRTLGRSFVQP
jgi:hypothetical protein